MTPRKAAPLLPPPWAPFRQHPTLWAGPALGGGGAPARCWRPGLWGQPLVSRLSFSIHRVGAPGFQAPGVGALGPLEKLSAPPQGSPSWVLSGGSVLPSTRHGHPSRALLPRWEGGWAGRQGRLPLCRGSVFGFQNGQGDPSGCPFQVREARWPEALWDPTGRAGEAQEGAGRRAGYGASGQTPGQGEAS